MLQPTPTSHILRFLSSYSFEPLKSLSRRRLKQQHELWASRLLLKHLDIPRLKTIIGNPEHQQPDVIINTPDTQLGIEVTTVYYDQEQAKEAWDQLKGDSPQAKNLESQQRHQTDQILIYNIQQAIERKAAKTYRQPGQLWLLIVVNRPFKSKHTAQQLPKVLHTKQVHNFDRIFVLYQDPANPIHQVVALQTP